MLKPSETADSFWDYLVYPLLMFWKRTVDCFTDPLRCPQTLTHFGMIFFLARIWTGSWLKALGYTVSYFVTYEFILEPFTRYIVKKPWYTQYCWFIPRVGPYCERGPRDGEKFIHE